MSSRASSSSPLKSRSTTPLQAKCDNIKRAKSTSPLKQVTSTSTAITNENEYVQANSKPLARLHSTYLSPTKSPLRQSPQSPFSTVQLRKTPKFEIYQDSTDYRAQLVAEEHNKQPFTTGIAQLATPEQDNKENYNPSFSKDPAFEQGQNSCLQNKPLKRRRIPLVDLDIKQYPGFSQDMDYNALQVLEPRYQLTEKYEPEQEKCVTIPAFATPSRKRLSDIKFVYKTDNSEKKDLTTRLAKCKSFDGRVGQNFVQQKNLSMLKPNSFKIFNDDV